MNAFSRLSEIIFSYEAGAKKVLRSHSIHCNNNSIIILFTNNFKQLFFALMLLKKTEKFYVVFEYLINIELPPNIK